MRNRYYAVNLSLILINIIILILTIILQDAPNIFPNISFPTADNVNVLKMMMMKYTQKEIVLQELRVMNFSLKTAATLITVTLRQ